MEKITTRFLKNLAVMHLAVIFGFFKFSRNAFGRNHRRQRGTRYDSPKLIVVSEVEVRLPIVNRRQRGTSTDSPKLIVGSEVRVPTPQS